MALVLQELIGRLVWFGSRRECVGFPEVNEMSFGGSELSPPYEGVVVFETEEHGGYVSSEGYCIKQKRSAGALL